MQLPRGGIGVVREGAVTRVFVFAGRSPRRILTTVASALLGTALLLGGAYIFMKTYLASGMLDFPAFGLMLAGGTLDVIALGIAPKHGRWTCQLIYDGEAVYSLGGGSGLREPLHCLRLVGLGRDTCVIYGEHGMVSCPMLRVDAEAVLRVLESAARESLTPDHHRSRIVTHGDKAEAEIVTTSALPRPGVLGVDTARHVFWPLIGLLLALPTMIGATGVFYGASLQWDSIAFVLVGAGLLGYAMAGGYLAHGTRQRHRRSAPLLPHGVTYTPDSLRVADGAAGRWSHEVVEVPFSELHNVELLDPDDDAVSRMHGVHGIPASGIVLIRGSNRDIAEGHPGTRTVVLRGVSRTDALQIRETILLARDRWRNTNPLPPDAVVG